MIGRRTPKTNGCQSPRIALYINGREAHECLVETGFGHVLQLFAADAVDFGPRLKSLVVAHQSNTIEVNGVDDQRFRISGKNKVGSKQTDKQKQMTHFTFSNALRVLFCER